MVAKLKNTLHNNFYFDANAEITDSNLIKNLTIPVKQSTDNDSK